MWCIDTLISTLFDAALLYTQSSPIGRSVGLFPCRQDFLDWQPTSFGVDVVQKRPKRGNEEREKRRAEGMEPRPRALPPASAPFQAGMARASGRAPAPRRPQPPPPPRTHNLRTHLVFSDAEENLDRVRPATPLRQGEARHPVTAG